MVAADARRELIAAVVPARGGSKGIPRKNLRLLGGRTLLQRAIECAQAVDLVDLVVVSTDDDEIAAHATSFGADVVRRPEALARDDSLVIDTLRHVRESLCASARAASAMVLLEPTSPLRVPRDVENCIRLLIDRELDSVATFTEASLHPHRAWRMVEGRPVPFVQGAIPWVRRQDLHAAFELNGAVYAFRSEILDGDGPGLLVGRSAAITMPADRSIDVDDEFDLAIAELLLQKGLA